MSSQRIHGFLLICSSLTRCSHSLFFGGRKFLKLLEARRSLCSLENNAILLLITFLWLIWHFVPNLTIGAPVIESLRKHTQAYLDCHLMVTNPLAYVEPFGKAGASGFTFHVEVSKDNWQELVEKIKLEGMRPGVALKPGTPIEEVYPLVEGHNPVEMVLVMTVEPGFGGQKFMPETMDKLFDHPGSCIKEEVSIP
ncbi:ribulose-phosphate 3-epimerase, cytoplasmic isoform isoform X3 [Beta vulgaris subsp. vulgaris]|uniref:ribulose-phosphate 3-epimerase, cytoplasmic isoform isoform X3 n=1 Tax=Beta vulgaris subsp. vulgaris TaxID=3555 RepID=UPI0025485FCB|nr:ribulose-phosphate 3-epimerase, cytoplasmic isoform isoform X3 [Beta vulgaris subsp. vulgaris]